MNSNKVALPGSERRPIGTRVGVQPADEIIEVSVILKPKARAPLPQEGGATVTRAEFAASHGADPAAISKIESLAAEYDLTVSEITPVRRTVKLQGSAANLSRAFDVAFESYEAEGYKYRARTGTIKVPSDIAESVEAVVGLDSRPQAKPHFRRYAGAAAAAVSIRRARLRNYTSSLST
jgi:kumamolisin